MLLGLTVTFFLEGLLRGGSAVQNSRTGSVILHMNESFLLCVSVCVCRCIAMLFLV